VVVAAGGAVRVWYPARLGGGGAELVGEAQATGEVAILATARGGGHIAWATAGGSAITIWDVETGTRRLLEGHTGAVRALAFGDDDTLASSGADRRVMLWDVHTGLGTELDGHREVVRALAFAPDGKTLASGGDDDEVRIWDVKSRHARVLRGHGGDVVALVWSPDGRQVASGGRDGVVRVWPDSLPAGPELRAWLESTLELEVRPPADEAGETLDKPAATP
jgi:WD40 repeat protein